MLKRSGSRCNMSRSSWLENSACAWLFPAGGSQVSRSADIPADSAGWWRRCGKNSELWERTATCSAKPAAARASPRGELRRAASPSGMAARKTGSAAGEQGWAARVYDQQSFVGKQRGDKPWQRRPPGSDPGRWCLAITASVSALCGRAQAVAQRLNKPERLVAKLAMLHGHARVASPPPGLTLF